MNGLMTAEELGEALAVSPDTIRSWTRKQWIPAVRVSPRVIRYDWHTVLRELAKRQTGVVEDPNPCEAGYDPGGGKKHDVSMEISMPKGDPLTLTVSPSFVNPQWLVVGGHRRQVARRYRGP